MDEVQSETSGETEKIFAFAKGSIPGVPRFIFVSAFTYVFCNVPDKQPQIICCDSCRGYKIGFLKFEPLQKPLL
ncbi:hypothetical protein D770_13295 [Flammeovirgaceae bacterium 311]|nr:hypothetical protein D770_13295 [Flammeovirgaceae bacterium 311]